MTGKLRKSKCEHDRLTIKQDAGMEEIFTNLEDSQNISTLKNYR